MARVKEDHQGPSSEEKGGEGCRFKWEGSHDWVAIFPNILEFYFFL